MIVIKERRSAKEVEDGKPEILHKEVEKDQCP